MKEFIRFKLKGCPACVDSQPAWNNFTRSCRGRLAKGCRLKEIDSEKAQAYPFEVDSFPTYVIYSVGTVTPYEGSRETADLRKHIQKNGFMKKSRKKKPRS